jgi:hypothetical protein
LENRSAPHATASPCAVCINACTTTAAPISAIASYASTGTATNNRKATKRRSTSIAASGASRSNSYSLFSCSGCKTDTQATTASTTRKIIGKRGVYAAAPPATDNHHVDLPAIGDKRSARSKRARACEFLVTQLAATATSKGGK